MSPSPVGTTTEAPATTTTEAPATTTTEAPAATTTEAPATTTTEAPNVTTTAGPGPAVDSFTGAVKEDDSVQQHPESLQIESGKSVVLSWTVSNAPDGVELTDPAQSDPQRFDGNTLSVEVAPLEELQEYVLVAIAGDRRSAAKTVLVGRHAPDETVSPHTLVSAPDGWFEVTVSGGQGKKLNVYHEGELVLSDVELDEQGHARIDGLPAAESYQIEVPDCTLALEEETQTFNGDSVA